MKSTRETLFTYLRDQGFVVKDSEEQVAKEVLDWISTTLSGMSEGDRLELRGIGTFRAMIREGRRYINPITGLEEFSSQKSVIKFIQGKNVLSDEQGDIDHFNRKAERHQKLGNALAAMRTKSQPTQAEPVDVVSSEDRKAFTVSDYRDSFNKFISGRDSFTKEECQVGVPGMIEEELDELLDYFDAFGTISANSDSTYSVVKK